MNKLINYKGLYGDNQEPFFSHIPHHEILETRSQLYDWSIDLHIHTELCQIFIFTAGNGSLITEKRTIALEMPCIVFIPNNTLHGFTFHSDIKGDVFTFSERIFKEIAHNMTQVALNIRQLQQCSFIEKHADFEVILLLKTQLIRELKNMFPEKNIAAQLYLQILFIHIYRGRGKADNHISLYENKTLLLYHTFRQHIFDYMHQLMTVKEHAQMLNISILQLNKICKMVAQKTPLTLIHYYKIEEAKRLLRHNEYAISEVSYKIGIADAGYFSRLFKQETGMTPKMYREAGH